MQIHDKTGGGSAMSLTDWHGFSESVRWRVTASGVEIEGSGVERSRGAPRTATAVWDAYGRVIDAAARSSRVPVELIVATICTESAGRADAVREEPGYTSDTATPNRVSAGLTQTLISTAQEVMQMSFGRDWLFEPANAVAAGTGYIAKQARLTSLDPPLVAAAYNAGQLRYQGGSANRWKLRQFPIGTGEHVDRFVRFLNDTVVVLAAAGARPSVSITALLDGEPPRPRAVPAASTPVGGAPATLRWGSNAKQDVVPEYAKSVLAEIAGAAGLADVLVSSTQRTPADQARVMYDNCAKHGPASQHDLYGSYGDKVIDVYQAGADAGRTMDQIRGDMTAKIIELGSQNVSRHTADPRRLAVIDVAPSSVRDTAAFERAAGADKRVSLFLLPPKDPAYHLEIPIGRL